MKRDQITSAVVDRMKTIRVANGYSTDAGTNVERDRTDPMGASEDYMIDIIAGAWETDEEPNRSRRWMNLSVAFATQGSTAVGVRDQIIEDVIKAVYTDLTWGGLAILTEEVGGAADKDTADTLFAWGEVDFRILYDTANGQI